MEIEFLQCLGRDEMPDKLKLARPRSSLMPIGNRVPFLRRHIFSLLFYFDRTKFECNVSALFNQLKCFS